MFHKEGKNAKWRQQTEWGIVYAGRILISAVDEDGGHQVEELGYGDIWYFPKGIAHTVQGLEDENEFLLVFDERDFDRVGCVCDFMPYFQYLLTTPSQQYHFLHRRLDQAHPKRSIGQKLRGG